MEVAVVGMGKMGATLARRLLPEGLYDATFTTDMLIKDLRLAQEWRRPNRCPSPLPTW